MASGKGIFPAIDFAISVAELLVSSLIFRAACGIVCEPGLLETVEATVRAKGSKGLCGRWESGRLSR